jgi:hypothetical protein
MLTMAVAEFFPNSALSLSVAILAVAAIIVFALFRRARSNKRHGYSPKGPMHEFSDLPPRDCEDVIWRQFNTSLLDSESPRIMCVGSTALESRMLNLAQQVLWHGYSSDLLTDFEAAIDAQLTSKDAWVLMIIDLDHVELAHDIEDIIDDLQDMRAQCQALAVILLSHKFSKDDPGLTRAAIADYSFLATRSNEKIIEHFPDVLENHKAAIARRNF